MANFFTISWSVAHFLFLGVFKGRSRFFFSFSHFDSTWSYIEVFKRRWRFFHDVCIWPMGITRTPELTATLLVLLWGSPALLG